MITYDFIDQLITLGVANGITSLDLIVKEVEVDAFMNEVGVRFPKPEARFIYAGQYEESQFRVDRFIRNGSTLNFWILKMIP